MYSVVRQRLAERILPHISALALQQGIMLLVANVLGNVLQYLFHFFASHALGPEEYGIVTTLLGLSMILSVPAGIAQTVITQYVSGFYAKKEWGHVAALFADAMKALSLASVAAFGLILIASPFIAAFLNVPSAVPVVAMASMFLFMGPFITLIGALQGLQQFNCVGAQLVAGPGFRLAFGILLISIGWGAGGALGATTLSNLFFIGIALFWTRDLWSGKADGHGLTWGSISQYSGIVFLGTLAFTISTNIDLVIVKHFFPPVQAGYYSAASVLGKVILFVPGAIATLMFPKTSYRYALGQNASDLGWAPLSLPYSRHSPSTCSLDLITTRRYHS
jgi:O-antigen/teichoic acid export membrane protein